MYQERQVAQKRLAAQPRASLPKFVRSTLVHYPPYAVTRDQGARLGFTINWGFLNSAK